MGPKQAPPRNERELRVMRVCICTAASMGCTSITGTSPTSPFLSVYLPITPGNFSPPLSRSESQPLPVPKPANDPVNEIESSRDAEERRWEGKRCDWRKCVAEGAKEAGYLSRFEGVLLGGDLFVVDTRESSRR